MRFPLPRFIQFYPTFRCNQNCSFCFNDSPEGGEMSFDNAMRLLGILSASGIGELDIMGGEPLLLGWMPDFVEDALRKGISVNLSTNGSDPRMIRRLRCFAGKKLSIGVSLEGSTEKKHNSLTGSCHFSAALKSIQELSSSGFSPIVKTVVDRRTMDDIQAIVDLLKKKDVRRYYLIHMDLLSRGPAMRSSALSYPAFSSFYKKIRDANPDISVLKVNASCFEKNTLPPGVRCAGGVRKLAVMPDGSTYPCNLFHRMRSFRLGNIFDAGIPALWESSALDVFRHEALTACGIPDCPNGPLCTGGCLAHAFFHGGNASAPDLRCAL
jgi:radical SAM protein with 4Fe4S-binding SPASM domain